MVNYFNAENLFYEKVMAPECIRSDPDQDHMDPQLCFQEN